MHPSTHPVQLQPTASINSPRSVTPFAGTQIALPTTTPDSAHNFVSTGYNQTIVVQNVMSNTTHGVPGNTSQYSFPVTVIQDVTATSNFENPAQSIQTSVPVFHLAGTEESNTAIQNVVTCPDFQLSLQSSQPSTSVEHLPQSRVGRPRRPIKKPLRLQDAILLEESSIQIIEEGPVRAHIADSNARLASPGHASNTHSGEDNNPVAMPEAVPSTSSGRRRGGRQSTMTGEQKYLRTRQLNNEASKRCREKRKINLSLLEQEELCLLQKNEKLKEKVALLTQRRNKMKKLVDMVFAKSVQAKYGDR